MNWCLSIAAALSIAGMALYGSVLRTPPALSVPTAREASSGIAAPALTRPDASVSPSNAPPPAAKPSARRPVFRGEKLIGWVEPDPRRAASQASRPVAKAAQSNSTAAKPTGATRAASAPRTPPRDRIGAVSRVKSEFRKASRKRFYRKPAWLSRRTLGDEFRQPDPRQSGHRS